MCVSEWVGKGLGTLLYHESSRNNDSSQEVLEGATFSCVDWQANLQELFASYRAGPISRPCSPSWPVSTHSVLRAWLTPPLFVALVNSRGWTGPKKRQDMLQMPAKGSQVIQDSCQGRGEGQPWDLIRNWVLYSCYDVNRIGLEWCLVFWTIVQSAFCLSGFFPHVLAKPGHSSPF